VNECEAGESGRAVPGAKYMKITIVKIKQIMKITIVKIKQIMKITIVKIKQIMKNQFMYSM